MDHDPFIRSMNIIRFRSLLETEIDEKKRQVVRRLLAEAEAGNLSPQWEPPFG